MPAAERAARVLVVDDHPMVREGLRSMLDGEGVEIVGEAASGAEAVARAAELLPDVVLLDLELPDLDGLTVLRRVRQTVPAAAVLVVTMHQDPARVRLAVEAGAAGYVLKGVDRTELRASILAVRDGGSVFDPRLLRAALDVGDGRSRGAAPAYAPALSRIEVDLLRLIAEGLTNREIGRRLRWSPATVKKYVQRILSKLDVPDRTRAAVEAVRRGLLG
jgi:DNA-binding NarL/FixJ family response regulator